MFGKGSEVKVVARICENARSSCIIISPYSDHAIRFEATTRDSPSVGVNLTHKLCMNSDQTCLTATATIGQ